jgi:hypothetical protein
MAACTGLSAARIAWIDDLGIENAPWALTPAFRTVLHLLIAA